MGKEVNVSLKGCDPLREQIQKWKNKTITVTVRGEEVTLNLSQVEQMEHVIDGLFLTGNADKAREMWSEMLGGKDVWDDLIKTLYKASQTNNLKIADYVEQLAAAAPRARLTKKRMLEHSEAIALVLSRQQRKEITKEQVLAELELYFVYNPKTGWAEPLDTIKQDLEMGVGVKGVLQQVNTVEEALAISEGMAIISGVAGAGKTSAVAAAAEMWAESGGEEKTVWCVSRNAKTAMDLGNVVRDVFIRRWRLGGRTPGIQNMSLAKFRGEVGKGYGPKPGDRVIVDEYALAEREDFLLLTELAKSKVAVTMLGDPHQQEAIETPTAAQWVGELAKAFGQPILKETKRCAGWKQQHDWLRAAPFDELARKAIIDDLVRDGNTEVVWDVASLVKQAIQSGCDMILAIDNETVNLIADEWRRQLGRVDESGSSVTLRGEVDGYVGDSIRIRRIIYNKKGEQLARTGERGKIISIEGNIVEIEIRDEYNARVIKIPTDLCGEVVSLGYASTIDSAQGMTCSKVGLVLKGMENSHAFYSGGSRGILFPKILIFNNIGDLGDGSQFLQPEIEPRIVLEQVLSRSNRSPDVENLDFYLSEFRRLGDKFGENLVIQLLENDLGADLIPPPPPQPPPPPVIQEPIQLGFGFEFEFGSAPVIPPPTPPPVVPTPTPQPPPSPVPTSVAQTVRELCEELLAYDVVDLTRIGEELIKNSGELLEYLQIVDAATREKIRRKLPPAVVGEIERRWREQQQQATPITPVAAPQQPPAPPAAPVISPPGQVVIKRHVLLPEIQYIQRPSPSPVPTPQPPPSPTVVPPAPATTPQTMQQLCASLLTSDVAGATRIGEELIKNVQEFATHWETLDSASRKIVLSKLPERIIREIERKLIKQQQNEREIEF